MEVILLERVGHLGQMGDVVRVKPGYARNYLLPKRKALRATADNLKYFETQRVQLEADNLARADDARTVGDKLDGVSVILIRAAGEGGQLYGSVSARDVAQALEGEGFTVARGQVEIDRPIKSLGLFAVRVALHPEVSATVTVNVARSADEAEMQRLHGGMVTADMVEAAIEAADEEARRIADGETAADDASSEPAADTDLAETDPAGDTDLADTGTEREDISTL